MAGIIEEDSIAPVDDIVVDEMTLECRDDCVPRCVRVPQEADAVIRSVELLFQELDDVFSILDAAGELPNMFIVVYADYEGEGGGIVMSTIFKGGVCPEKENHKHACDVQGIGRVRTCIL